MSTQNVHTYIRVRPFLSSDPQPHTPAFQIHNNRDISASGSDSSKAFSFDYVFDESHTNTHVFERIGANIINDVLSGRNAVIFAYGQTSSGKTFAIAGSQQDMGILPRSIKALFDSIHRTYHGREFLIRCSYLEIYNETIRDLLRPTHDGTAYKLREKPSGEVYVENLHEVIVCTAEQMNHYVQLGMRHRSVGATGMNQNSSRSHCIFHVTVESVEIGDDSGLRSEDAEDDSPEMRQRRSSIRQKGDWDKTLRVKGREVCISHLYVVDLAGSERVSQSKTSGQRLKEGNAINQSLSTLSKVISLLAEQSSKSSKKSKPQHIPYRDSKLTRILQVGLGGNSKLTVLCCLTPSASQEPVSTATLRFAEMLKRVKNRAKINRVLDDSALIRKYKKEIEELRRQVRMASVDIELQKLQQEKMNAEEAMQQAERRRKELEDVVEHLTRLIIHGPKGGSSMEEKSPHTIPIDHVAEALKRTGGGTTLLDTNQLLGADTVDISKKLSHAHSMEYKDMTLEDLEKMHREEISRIEAQYKKQLAEQRYEMDEMQQEIQMLQSAGLDSVVMSPRRSSAPVASRRSNEQATDLPPKTLPVSSKYAFSLELQKLNMALQRISDAESVYSTRLSDGSLPDEWLDRFEKELGAFEEDINVFRDELAQEMASVFDEQGRSGTSPKTYEEVFTRLFLYLDRLMSVIQPRKVLYLSIDGPAPRAKMNQQRYRRFRAVVDRTRIQSVSKEMTEPVIHALKRKLQEKGLDHEDAETFRQAIKELSAKLDSNAPKGDNLSDSNVITPGTEFMERLSEAVMYYVTYRMSTDPLWKNITVLVSDSSVPGEGEQKIFDFVREMRQFEKYDPLTSHVIHGLDADLVMLSLLTHEPNFFILREDVFDKDTVDLKKPLGLFQIRPLRVKLAQTFHALITEANMNLERIINDFIFLLYFMGNDFIPHIASIDIHDSIAHVCNEYIQYQLTSEENKREYFTEPKGYINIPRVIHFIRTRLLPYEQEVMKLRLFNWSHTSSEKTVTDFETPRQNARKTFGHEFVQEFVNNVTKEKDSAARSIFSSITAKLMEKYEKKIFHMPLNRVFPKIVMTQEEGWQEDYYRVKYRCPEGTDQATLTKLRKNVAKEYLKGVVWVWQYYTLTDTPSWSWFYPHHFGPLFADFELLQPKDLKDIFQFSYDAPFAPFDQLFAVLPEKSLDALPVPYQQLVQHEELKEYFPHRFEIDLNGHDMRHAFKAVPLLPFMEQGVLKKHTREVARALNADETRRNTFGHTIAFFRKRHKPMKNLVESDTFKNASLNGNEIPQTPNKDVFVNHIQYNMAGYLYNMSESHPQRNIVPKRKQNVESPFGDKSLFPSFKNDIYSAIYILPQTPDKEKKFGILPGFNFDKFPKLAPKWFGSDLRIPENAYSELLKPIAVEKPQVVIVQEETDLSEEDNSDELRDEPVDEMADAVKRVEADQMEDVDKEEEGEAAPTATPTTQPQPVTKQVQSNKIAGHKRKRQHGFHKVALNQEDPLAKSGDPPPRFAFDEKSRTYPHPIFEQQAELAPKQGLVARKKKVMSYNNKRKQELKAETLQFKVRNVSQKGRQENQSRNSKRRKIT